MIEGNICLVCKNATISFYKPTLKERYEVECPRCGNYVVSVESLTKNNLDEKENARLLLSHWIRTHQKKETISLSEDIIKNIILNEKLPTQLEQVENLLLYIGDNFTKPSEPIKGTLIEVAAIIGSIDEYNVKYHMNFLERKGLISVTYEDKNLLIIGSLDRFSLSLLHEGWVKYYELQRSNKDSRLAFMAMKFGDDVLTEIYNEVMKEAVKKTGFDLRDLGENKEAGLIDNKLRVEIRRSKFLIADLSHDNNGAYWEAGFAEGLGMKVIYVCQKKKFDKKETHFDTNHQTTIFWTETPEGRAKFAEDLKASIRATFPNEAIMND